MKILGLDLGTNSIGWAVRETDLDGNQITDKGVRIFSEGVKSEKGIESSRAAERTSYRNARKIKYRRKLRKFETLKVLSKNGMCPLSIEDVIEWKKSGFRNYPLSEEFLLWLRTDDKENVNPYYFRFRASKEKITKFELGRALYHIAQRRGFKSGRLDQSAEGIMEEHAPRIQNLIEDIKDIDTLRVEIDSYFEEFDIIDNSDLDEGEKKLKSLYRSLQKLIKDNSTDVDNAKEEIIKRLNRKEDLGDVKREIGEISQAMKDGNFSTIGQYFYSLYNNTRIRNHYTAREEHYLNEFEIICKTQGLENINENENVPEKRYSGIIKELYRAIFFQRPLKSQKGTVGKCSFEKNKSRCPISHPDFEEYRMWSFINTIKIKTPEDHELRFLNEDEKNKIIPKFMRKKEHFNFEDIAKELILKNATFEFYKSSKAKAANYLFNYKSNDTVSGCPVSASLKNSLGDDWKSLKFLYKTINKNETEKKIEVDYRDLWHLLTVATSEQYLYDYAIEKLKLDEKKTKSFSQIRLKKDYASLSLSAINKILPYLKAGLLYSHAVFMANIEKIVDEDIWNDSQQRIKIQEQIASIVDNYVFENSLIEIVNGLIRISKINKEYYSKEAEPSYKNTLVQKLEITFKKFKITSNEEKTEIINYLFPVYMQQLQKQEFIVIKRLDEKVIDYLSGKNENGEVLCSDKKRLKKLFHPSDIEKFKNKIVKDINGNEIEILGSPLTPSIKNPMAMRALHQLRKVLNTLIVEGKIDKKTRVHIEMARELNDANRRKGIQDFQNENKIFRQNAILEIKKLYFEETNKEIEPTEDDLLRYQLWIEQNKDEIYEATLNNGKAKCIKISQIIGSNPEYDIEHTIPRSISQDNSLMNKTLCSARFNREIKGKKMPVELHNYDLILPIIKHWKDKADVLDDEIKKITRSIKAVATKEAKDRKIRKRHLLTLRRDYWMGKYQRFIDEEPKTGFKNSQIPDTGIITKYANAYLKSYFNRVDSVKGGMVAEFRKIWGIQKSYTENDKKYYEEKDRSKHTHHTIDAITIACMTKDKYDVLAEAWTLEDEERIPEARKKIAESKPWNTFTQDMEKIEKEILVSHFTPDNVKKQSKKIFRIRGEKQFLAEIDRNNEGKAIPKRDENDKIVYKLDEKGNKIPRMLQGDTMRGSLHQESIYGAIKNPLNQEEIKYVIRKNIESIKQTDIENIVDEAVKEKIKEAVARKVLIIASNPQQKNKIGGTVWMNEEKQIPIRKVRIVANSVKNPLHIKHHAPLSKSHKTHKQIIYGQNDENYAMALYELNGKREFELINNFDVSKLLKGKQGFYPLFKEKRVGEKIVQFPILKSNNRDVVLRRGQQVIFYDNKIENPKDVNDITDLENRIYIIEGLSIQRIVRPTGKIDEYGVITFRYFKEARKADEIKKDNFKPDGEYKFGEIKPTRKMNHNQFVAFVENIDFKVMPTGEIIKI